MISPSCNFKMCYSTQDYLLVYAVGKRFVMLAACGDVEKSGFLKTHFGSKTALKIRIFAIDTKNML